MQTYTVSQAAARLAGRAADAPHPESTGLVVPERSAAGYRRYGSQEFLGSARPG